MIRRDAIHRSSVALVLTLLLGGLLVQWGRRSSPAIDPAKGPASDVSGIAPSALTDLVGRPARRQVKPADVDGAEPSELDVDPADRPADWPTDLPPGLRTARLKLDCVDAQTGHPVDAKWALRGPSSASPPDYVAPENPPVDFSSLTDDRRRRALDAAAEVIEDGTAIGHLEVAASGYVDLKRSYRWTTIATDVKELRFRAPMVRWVSLHATVLGPDGRPASDAVISHVFIAGAFESVGSDPSDERGSLEVRAIPFFPGEAIGGFVEWESEGTARPASTFPDRRFYEWSSIVPTDPAAGWSEVVRLSGPSSSGDDRNPFEGRGEDPPADTFAARDENGFRTGVVDPTLARGRVNVSCVDVRGLPCPSAELDVEAKHGDPIFDVTDGVQRLDPFTDERGRRTFSRVPPDTIRVRATWGSRRGETIFDVKPGETKDVHVVLK